MNLVQIMEKRGGTLESSLIDYITVRVKQACLRCHCNVTRVFDNRLLLLCAIFRVNANRIS